MNKTYLIAGGTAVVSLAAGAAGGYFIAKKRFNAELEEAIAREVQATKEYYLGRLEEAKKDESSDEEIDLGLEDDEEEGAEAGEPEESEELGEEDRAVVDNAQKALVDYQGYSKPPLKDVAQGKITKNKPKKPLPPRGPGGAFRSKTVREKENDPPQIIELEDFMLNDPEHDQESLLYFVNDKTLVLSANPSEPIEIGLVGEVNLTLFPADEEPSMIYVRNTGLSIDYEIKCMKESLTEFIGLGEYAGSDEENLDETAYL